VFDIVLLVNTYETNQASISGKYEGRSINKLQNGIILLIKKIKIRNTGFLRNLILSNTCEFYYNIVTVASFVNDKYGDVTVESIPNGILLCVFCGQQDLPRCIHSKMRPVYGDKRFTRAAICVWCNTSMLVDEKVMLMKKDRADVLQGLATVVFSLLGPL